MLPTHNLPPPATESLARLSKGGNPFTKSILRYLTLGCVLIFGIWFAGPFIGSMVWGPPPHDLDYYPSDPIPSYERPHHNKSLEDQETWEPRKYQVREAFKHAWSGYKTKAFPNDELLAKSGGKSNKFNGWGVTLFDSLDTMWIMGLEEEFASAVASVKDLKFKATKPDHFAPFFETTIRYLGGLLSAYALSGDETLLRMADEMGEVLVPAFHGTGSGLPAYSVNVETGKIQADMYKNTVLFAEATTCQLEFKYLAKLTGKKDYYDSVQKAMNIFYKANATNGLFEEHWNMKDGTPNGIHYTIGAAADSGYEYLLKQWLQSGDAQAKEQYIKSANGIIHNLIYVTPKRGLMYVGDLQYNRMVHRLEHLSCFLPGLFALGAATLDLTPEDKELHEWAAYGLTYTCAMTYADQETGLGPDEVRMAGTGEMWVDLLEKWKAEGRPGSPPGLSDPPVEKVAENRDYFNGWPNDYLLRPETVESIFYMWRTTGDVRWRERGYSIFLAIQKHARTKHGFASVRNVDGARRHIDDMPSYFLAETLKYLYLLFDDVNSITFDKWVFNTEAHPLPVFTWTEAEKEAFSIP